MFNKAQSSPVSAIYSFELLMIDFVRFENQGSSRTTWPEASRQSGNAQEFDSLMKRLKHVRAGRRFRRDEMNER